MGHGFMPTITIHISLQIILYYPITGYVVMKILSVVRPLVHKIRGQETLSFRTGEDKCC